MYTKPPSARRDSSLDARFSSRLRVLFDVWSVLKMNHPYAEFDVKLKGKALYGVKTIG